MLERERLGEKDTDSRSQRGGAGPEGRRHADGGRARDMPRP